jgi:hypothetical protein
MLLGDNNFLAADMSIDTMAELNQTGFQDHFGDNS